MWRWWTGSTAGTHGQLMLQDLSWVLHGWAQSVLFFFTSFLFFLCSALPGCCKTQSFLLFSAAQNQSGVASQCPNSGGTAAILRWKHPSSRCKNGSCSWIRESYAVWEEKQSWANPDPASLQGTTQTSFPSQHLETEISNKLARTGKVHPVISRRMFLQKYC